MRKYFIKTIAFMIFATGLSCMDSTIEPKYKKTIKYWANNFIESPYSYNEVFLPLRGKYLPIEKSNKDLTGLVRFIKKNTDVTNISISRLSNKIYIQMSESCFGDLKRLIEERSNLIRKK